MLVVLLLVVLAAGVLVAAVALHTPELAWGSLLLAVLGGLLLLLLEKRRRRAGGSGLASGRHRVRRSENAGSQSTSPPGESGSGRGPRSSEPVGGTAAPAGRTALIAPASSATLTAPDSAVAADGAAATARGGSARMSGSLAESAGSAGSGGRWASATPDPGVERVTVGVHSRAQLNARVLVVDGRPRYHLEGCPWLAEQAGPQPMGLTVEKAHELGFTPCARCGPDEHLARRHQAG
ncbi:hypothetical protein [Salinifilum ghardaiensis]